MLDFRYHALSLVAVFLALAIGIVLGVTIGNGLVSDAERSLRGGLRADVENARSAASQAKSDVAGRDRMLDQLYPQLVAGRLNSERVALVSWGPLPDNVANGVRDAVSKAGGRLDSISVFDTPLTDLKQVLGTDQFAIETADEQSLRTLGADLARSLVTGDRLASTLRASSPDNFSGRFKRADAVVFYEAPNPTDQSDGQGVKERSDNRAQSIETGLINELLRRTIAVVGVDASSTDPSVIARYKLLKLSSADSIDKSGGRIALVYALAGAKGNFGLKSSATQSLPPEVVTAP